MYIWVDDVRPSPQGWIWCKSVNEAKDTILSHWLHVKGISLDHDAGEYAKDGGDYIHILEWLEALEHMLDSFSMAGKTIHLHSMNTVGVENMRRIITHNHWVEVDDLCTM